MKKLLVISGLAFLLAGALVLGEWARGYFMLLAPLGQWTPLAWTGIVLVLMLLVVGSIIYLGVGKQPFRQRLAFAAGAVGALVYIVPTEQGWVLHNLYTTADGPTLDGTLTHAHQEIAGLRAW